MLRWLDRLEETLIATLIAAATLVIFVAVLQRYGVSNAVALAGWAKAAGYDGLATAAKSTFLFLNSWRLTWAQELCMFMIVWMAKIGAAYGVRTGIHVGVDILVNALPEQRRRGLILLSLAAGALFTAIIGLLGARLVWHIGGTGQTSAVLEAPMWIVYLAVPLGSFLMCFRFLQVAAGFARDGTLPHHDIGHVEGLDQPASGTRQ
ncbi:MAG: TRAP transporter small permease [Hyphomicrobium sp.]